MNWKIENKKEFYSKKSNLQKRVRNDFLEGDAAVLPCRVTDYYDIVNKYSEEGFETLNPQFVDYLQDMIRFIPAEYKLKLQIHGVDFSEEKKKRILGTLREDTMYELGAVEEEQKELKTSLLYNLIGLIIMWVVLSAFDKATGVSREFLYIFFWFFADVVISYILTKRRLIRNKHILAGRLSSMKVIFK